MNNASVVTDETSIAHAVAQINKGDWSAAEMSLNGIIRHNPNHPVGHYLLGLIASEQNRWSDAEKHLRKAHSLAPAQSRIVLLLVRSLRALGRSDDALVLCQSLPSQDVEIGLECAKCQEEAGDFLAAERTHNALHRAEGSANTVLEFARYLCRRSRAEEAEGLLRGALEGTTDIDEALRSQMNYQLGIVLKSQSRYEEALSHMSDVTSKDALGRSHVVERAGLFGQLGRLEEAAQTYEVHLNSDPLDLEIHALLNDIYHVLGREERIGTSYDIPKATGPQRALLQAAKGRLFLKRGDLQKAEDAFRTGLNIAPRDAELLAGLGHTLNQEESRKAAEETHLRNIALNPSDAIALEACGQFLLCRSDPRAAVDILSRALKIRPNSQSGLALLGSAYRACQDPREQWLNDYKRDIQIFDLPAPDGYRDMGSFNEELSAYLLALHGKAKQYPSQTLRGGTQTFEELFYRGHHLVDLLQSRINAAIQAYRAQLTNRPSHPFASRLGRGFRHTGSWSSCLQDSGYHVNHIHQKGWISSCYYVSLPSVVADSKSQQGWLKFGEPPSEFGMDWSPRRVVQPVVGRLVLFPSYMWHGTLAFRSSQPRVTIAFDTVPA